MITLHHLERSQSFRILWLLEELGVDYELRRYDRDEKTQAAPDIYKTLSPLGTAPFITDGDVALAESAAIIDYILDKYPDNMLRPSLGDANRDRYIFWFHAAQGSMMPIMLIDSLFRLISARVPFLLTGLIKTVLNKAMDGFAKPRMEALLALAETDLGTADWFGGEQITAADILLCYPMESASIRGYITKDHPNCQAWLARMHARPSFQTAKEKDGQDSMVLQF